MESQKFKEMQAKALKQLRSGQTLTGKGSVLALLLKQFIESALEADLASHLDIMSVQQGINAMVKNQRHLRPFR